MPSRSRSIALWLRLGSAMAVLAGAYACDARTPTAPTPGSALRQPNPVAHQVNAPITLHQMNFGVPPLSWLDPATGSIGGSVQLTPIRVAVSGPRWLRVRIAGEIEPGFNPDAAAYLCGDDTPHSCAPLSSWTLLGMHIGPLGVLHLFEPPELQVGLY